VAGAAEPAAAKDAVGFAAVASELSGVRGHAMTIAQDNRVRWPFRLLAGVIALCGIYALARLATELLSGPSVRVVPDLIVILPFTAAMMWVALYGYSPRWWFW